MNDSMLLINHQECLLNFRARLTFCRDDEIKKSMLNRYGMSEILWNPDLQSVRLQAKADQIRAYFEELYKTTTFDYNPIDNYDRTETYESKEHVDESVSENGTGTVNSGNTAESYQYPMQSTQPRPVTRQVDTANQSSSDSANTKRDLGKDHDYKLRARGNIGVVTTQSMIKQERDIIINIIDDYVKSFGILFRYSL